jgi:acetoin utilization deacetylase AcuC-like enzyme
MAIPPSTLVYHDPCFLRHDTLDHPESAERLRYLGEYLDQRLPIETYRKNAWSPATSEQLLRVHEPGYLLQLQEFAARGGGRIEQDTIVSGDSFEVARIASGAACDDVAEVVGGNARNALCLVRPPGHHALPAGAMGFCLLNHCAVAAAAARAEQQVDRVLVVDWDVHHGNGTQDIFWENSQVAFLSVHRWPFYPGSGHQDETGQGAGLGTTVNVPLPFGTSRTEYLERFTAAIETLADRHKPDLILLSAGFDAHRADPVGSLGLEEEDFEILTERVLAVADAHAAGRVVSILEGGYNPPVLARCIAVHLQTLLTQEG